MHKDIEYLLNEAVGDNILPLTGRCNLSCLFCSHRFNPPDADVYDLPPLGEERVTALMECLNPSAKIVIGESVTRLREGEPFTHPRIMAILKRIRNKFPATPLQITTNGTLLKKNILEELAATMMPLELIFSLNSAAEEGRRILTGDSEPAGAINAVKEAAGLKIPFHGSIVAMPHITGDDDLAETISFLDNNNARTIRIFIPGFTFLTSQKLRIKPEEEKKLRRFINKMQDKLETPILVEPPEIYDLKGLIEGIIANSPAHHAGLKRNDIINSVNEKLPRCRVEAFRMLYENENPSVKIVRNNIPIEKIIQKERESFSGVAMNYDIDPAHVERLNTQLRRGGKILLLTSEAAEPIWSRVANSLKGSKNNISSLKIWPVPADYWGGSIVCAGLLTVSDFRKAIIKATASFVPDVLMLPPAAFDRRGFDIRKESYHDLQTLFASGVKIIV